MSTSSHNTTLLVLLLLVLGSVASYADDWRRRRVVVGRNRAVMLRLCLVEPLTLTLDVDGRIRHNFTVDDLALLMRHTGGMVMVMVVGPDRYGDGPTSASVTVAAGARRRVLSLLLLLLLLLGTSAAP